MKRATRLSVLLLALLITLIAYSQPKPYIRHFGAEEGLLSPGINCLAEDRDGFIWIGSNMGLTRFDGIHFRNFPIVHEYDGAFALQPRHIVVDDENRIRISTRRGMFVFDHATGLFHRDSTYQQSLLHNGRDSLSWEQPVDAQLLAQIGWHSPTGGVRCMLTDHEGKTIREVSETLCFSSVAYFTNCFSRQFGVTPGEYCKQSSSPS